tara:strand:+ start:262 stop:711 length:450 start_codon:yes stop_codon:yes gene_type:complete
MKQIQWYRDYHKWSLQFFKKYWKYNVVFVFIFFLIFLINIHFSNKEDEEYAKEFPYYNTSNLISGVVSELEKFSIRRGEGVQFKLNDKKGYSLGWAYNDMYVPNKISEFLQKGDSISKRKETDSVFIYRNDNVYYFIVSKRIDKTGNFY